MEEGSAHARGTLKDGDTLAEPAEADDLPRMAGSKLTHSVLIKHSPLANSLSTGALFSSKKVPLPEVMSGEMAAFGRLMRTMRD